MASDQGGAGEATTPLKWMATAQRKPRSDAKLKNLTRPQQDRVWEWINAQGVGDAYEHARKQCWADFSIRTSVGALSEFYRWYAFRARTERMDSAAAQVEDLLKSELGDADPEKIRRIGDLLFMSEALNAGDGELYLKFSALRAGQLKTEAELDLKRRRIELLERREAEAKAAAGDQSLTPEERSQRIKEIFGIA